MERFAYIGHKHVAAATEPKPVVRIPPTKPAVLPLTVPGLETASTPSLTSAQESSKSVFKFADVLKDSTTTTQEALPRTTTIRGPTGTAILKSRPPTDDEKKAAQEVLVQDFGQHGQGRLEVDAYPPGTPMAKWVKQPGRWPIPPGKVIPLPRASPKTLPTIQHKFKEESASEKADRVLKLDVIKEAFNHSWCGYVEYALPHDELKSVSGGFADPFNGWGATLVDTLDTLWIMDMREEFEAAVEAVKKIDFTTSPRKDIPLFETSIRYLGGLLSAYDLTKGKYPALLDKALELANITIGAFDTPNHMPVTYYYWAPSYTSQPHRAGTRVVLAELGSLSVEFTRLAQITGEDKYYDAIARITDALEAWQMNTNLPGLWPAQLDASGCKKPTHPVEVASPVQNQALDDVESEYGVSATAHHKRQLDDASSESTGSQPGSDEASKPPKQNLALDVAESSTIHAVDGGGVDCERQGLGDVPHATKQVFGIGGMTDSTYEYLPKEYLLLGGQVDQYRTMYEDAIKTVKRELLFRPMTKDADDILAVGRLILPTQNAGSPSSDMIYEGTHLSCFAGGMFALGAKVFGLDDDLEIGRKLTEGCIWAYESTITGIMPETFEMVPCSSMTHCEWNEIEWHEALDPNHEARMAATKSFNDKEKEYVDRIRAGVQAENPTRESKSERDEIPDLPKPVSPEEGAKLRKRQTSNFIEDATEQPSPTVQDSSVPNYRARAPLSHKEYVAARIRDERLPEGYTRITSPTYGLRPEAIESVFIMYRLTGQQKYRDAGWRMFQAVEGYTRSEIGHATITDVTATVPVLKDTMESFWLAETLKYFYLLFSEPDLISLDDWVLNTEAHPFRRPI